MRVMRVAAAIVVSLLAGLTAHAGAEELKIGAGGAPTENILKPIRTAFETATGLKLYIVASGPKNAFADLQKGEVDAAAAGLSYQDWLALMKKEGAEVSQPAAFVPTLIGKDKVKVLVHKENKVNQLSAEQLRGIFSGEISSWKEVGGDDAPILVVLGKLTPGTNSMFFKKFLGDKPVAKDVIDATTAEDVRLNVASNPSAVGFGPLSLIDDSVKAVLTPELARDITLLTKGKPSAKVQKLLDFINGEGKKYIKQ
ncbi:substrate-binding domain-containing protein [Geomonas azotofigens]|uniref:substrate-binding domain-containing protein n=1 Tax=Geomonas azotofigens TaxID=2843196 RepID=UPI001C114602|nr:substrate-binding domain-containing protein [Geomonas azotofigens]MBU5611381.1 substrate-binding domain-containing protein [Geomonas azotofigens]